MVLYAMDKCVYHSFWIGAKMKTFVHMNNAEWPVEKSETERERYWEKKYAL